MGDKCEMNKFDDMMSLLQQEVPNFDLFTRVWCVAELVEAYLSGIPQNVLLLSRHMVDANSGDLEIYVKLATLSVSDCRATCPDDKAAILAKIPDVADFNAHLQAVIFGESGLFGRRLAGFDFLYSAARTACRVKAVKDSWKISKCKNEMDLAAPP